MLHPPRNLPPVYSYKTDFFFWEVVELLRRNVLVGWLLLFPSEKTFLRLVFALLLSISSLTLLLSTYPYARPEDNLLAAGCQLTLIFCFIGGGYVRLFEALSDYDVPTSVIQQVMAFSSTASIASPLVVITLAMGVLMLIIIVFLIRKEGGQATIRLSQTGMPPELTVEAGQKWHLFLYAVATQTLLQTATLWIILLCWVYVGSRGLDLFLPFAGATSGAPARTPTPRSSGSCSGSSLVYPYF